MALRIEDYALLSNLRSAALVGKNGSVDWLCFPRFDSSSIFAALLGDDNHGRWLLAPPKSERAKLTCWNYSDHNFILESVWESANGSVRITDFMPIYDKHGALVRRIEGLKGSMQIRQELMVRFDYARIMPWMFRRKEQGEHSLFGIAGPDAVILRGPHLPEGKSVAGHRMHGGQFEVKEGDVLDFELAWFPSHRPAPERLDVDKVHHRTKKYWREWAAECTIEGKYATDVERSLLTLRALTHQDTGGIVAAATTSLPESIGGERNWDYRFCWLRDASLTLQSMLAHGYEQEALLWRDWLLRAIAGDPDDLQIMYGLSGERNLHEWELDNLPGYKQSRPVRVGNGAVDQFQADVVGEVLVALDELRESGEEEDNFSWPLQRSLLAFVEHNFHRKDQGVWEMRGKPQYFTHGRAMMWAAFDRCVKASQKHGLQGDVKKWITLRDSLREEIMERGFNKELNSFTQTYDNTQVDASLLVLAQVGFVDYADEKMLGTVKQIEKELLTDDGLVLRYRTDSGLDGLSPGENPFLACSFWLVEQYARCGRVEEADQLMDQLCGYVNEVGLLSEEYDPKNSRMVGNYPQAFSHLALVRAADAIHGALASAGSGTAGSGASTDGSGQGSTD